MFISQDYVLLQGVIPTRVCAPPKPLLLWSVDLLCSSRVCATQYAELLHSVGSSIHCVPLEFGLFNMLCSSKVCSSMCCAPPECVLLKTLCFSRVKGSLSVCAPQVAVLLNPLCSSIACAPPAGMRRTPLGIAGLCWYAALSCQKHFY